MKSNSNHAGKFFLSFAFTCLTIFALSSAGAGGADVGGGLVAQDKAGNLKTLAQAGILLERLSNLTSKTYPVYYYISQPTKDALTEILATLQEKFPGPTYPSFDAIIGKRGTFITQSDVDPALYAVIKAEYSAALKAYGKNLDESAYSLAAYSTSRWDAATPKKTYILPIFEKLSSFQQALYLIHEYSMREGSKELTIDRLKAALELDTQIYKILQSNKALDSIGLTTVLATFNEQHILSDSSAFAILINHIQTKLGRPLLLGEFVTDPDSPTRTYQRTFDDRRDVYRADPSVIQNLNWTFPALATMLERTEISMKESETEPFYKDPAGVIRSVRHFCETYAYLLTSKHAQPNDMLIFSGFSDVAKWQLTPFAVRCYIGKKSALPGYL